MLSRSTTDLSRAPPSVTSFSPSFLPCYLSFPLSFSQLLYPVSPSRSTRSSSYFFSLSPSLSLALSLFFAPNVVSWGQCLLDRILSRNIPADEEEEEKDDLFPSERDSPSEAATVATRARARTHHVLRESFSVRSAFRATRPRAPRQKCDDVTDVAGASSRDRHRAGSIIALIGRATSPLPRSRVAGNSLTRSLSLLA